ncbi:two-component system chemotaxis sensor kinase CheA [Novosphingobium sp. PhB165]|uniref:chemotaxis protein CheA n=1 Tax=Novosphingobium sp. PhB165 TaxID=2485105 RepID=UPI001052A39C|nr:chemotaxis protein CheA [Novosphingobium sp. PhB165]TCM17717.1 two-component system chemotaxis sensor kinase CheA [Novosphingobium sp. PhB165]
MSDELDEIQAIFFEECVEGLAVAEEGLSAMAAGDTSAGVIAGVFRAVHSIKGGSGAFGHTALLGFSHRFENVLDEVRAGRIAPTPEVTQCLLGAFDILSDHVSAAQTGGDAPDDGLMLEQLDAILAGGGAPAAQPEPEPVAPEPVAAAEDEFGFVPVAAPIIDLDADFDPFGFEPVAVALDDFDAPEAAEPAGWTVRFGPSRAAMANGGEPLLVIRELESMGGEVTAVDSEALPPLAELDPEDSYFVWTLTVPASVDERDIRDCFDFVAPDSLIEVVRAEDTVVGGAEPGVAAFEELPFEPVPFEPISFEAEPVLAEPVPTPAPVAVAAPVEAPRPAVAAPKAEAPKPEAKSGGVEVAQSIRVDLGKLDQLLNLVGELVIRSSILSDRLPPADQERVELPELSRLIRQIQDNVMSLRAQPIKQAFSRVPRMLRDLMAETGKRVQLETTGEMTEVDKGVIEKIGDPLTHMIRNAVDHGIEGPEEREAAGKPAEGTIHLSAEQKGGRIIVRVRDDGRGINRERVRAKAIERGIITADAQLSDEEIDGLICAPGFSTAETISNISGRGVGMDVVRSNVESLGGRLEINSVPGEGTTFSMALPLTLAILDGMIVRLGEQRFVLPLANVIETVQPEPGQVQATSPTSEVIELRGQYLPVRRVGEMFGLRSQRAPEDSLVIIVESDTAGHVGLMVDTIDNRREVVIKSLEDNLHPIRGLGGATILGDGAIALILDVDALVVPGGGFSKYVLKGLAA